VNTNWKRAAFAAVTLATMLLGVSDAAAERIVVLKFTGSRASVLRDKVAGSLKRAGHTPIRSNVSSRGFSKKALQRVGKRADAVIAGRVESARKGDWSIALSVSIPKQGTLNGEELRFSGESLKELTKDVSENVSQRLEALLGAEKTAPAAPTRSEPEPSPVSDPPALEAKIAPSEATPGPENEAAVGTSEEDVALDTGTSSAEAPNAERTVVRLSARAGYVQRNFDFYDDIYDHLRKLRTKLWIYRAQAEAYPFHGLIGDRLGFILSYEGALAGNVRDLDVQAKYPVLHSELFGGVRAHQPLGPYEIGLDLAVGRMEAGLDDKDGAAGVPDLQYTLLRSSLDFKLNVGAVNVIGSIGFRLPLGFGEASKERWFPRMGGYGTEAGLLVGYQLTKHLSLEAVGSLRRYLIHMNSEPEDALSGASQVAAGAVDLYASGYFGLSYTL
jgi:hypothetical protein